MLLCNRSTTSIINYILDHPGETFDVAPFVDRRSKTPIEEIQAAVDGAISREQAVKLRQCHTHIAELEAHKKALEQEIILLAEPFDAVLDLLRTTPGLNSNPMTAIAVLAEIGPDMSVFPSSKNLVSWAGCCPRNDQKPLLEGFLEHRPVNESKVLTKSQALYFLDLEVTPLQTIKFSYRLSLVL